ncbi:GNAT family N-acetyltransferase [Arthrobacter zhaoxinii]|uniref:GNAT family N-acetyltransferase n=1 Tax=Arthrobacter zhaoxinii TaxID=2964616 RepID=A0ABY5YPQ6_9MICC|nr:GNAT family N-acetyltransferase [Arthrobacter zhaoxinii]UWX97060.1 GNAT family N-acetyltransferase [Arthrobacter zhaoxinii]
MYLRAAADSDFPFLVDILLHAFNWSGEPTFTKDQLLNTPAVSHYVAGWKREQDFGTVAETDDGRPIGAVWARLLSQADPGYGFVSDAIPELTMGVLPGHRGSGAGTALMTAVVEQAQGLGIDALSLSVEDANPARRLYERAGFRKVDRSGDSDTMLLRLP